MSARVIEGKWGVVASTPELTEERKAVLFPRLVHSLKYMADQLTITRDANRQIDPAKAQLVDAIIHEHYKALWRAQQVGANCPCWNCEKERAL
jgi:hypothetical protein